MTSDSSLAANASASTIRRTVLRRVRTIHALRAAASGAGIAVLTLAVSLYLIGREVWVARVWENMPSLVHLNAVARFFIYAFLHTHLIVQVLILITAFASVWVVRECARVLQISVPRLSGA